MPLKLNRRCFIARTVMASAGVAAAANAADNTNPADQAAAQKAAVPAAAAAMPTGKIGKLTVSRLVSGGNPYQRLGSFARFDLRTVAHAPLQHRRTAPTFM